MPLPHSKATACGDTIPTLKGLSALSARTKVCQMFPAADNTSSMPYKAEPAVSGTATINTSVGPLRGTAMSGPHIVARTARFRQKTIF
jgi:hypothetical protein